MRFQVQQKERILNAMGDCQTRRIEGHKAQDKFREIAITNDSVSDKFKAITPIALTLAKNQKMSFNDALDAALCETMIRIEISIAKGHLNDEYNFDEMKKLYFPDHRRNLNFPNYRSIKLMGLPFVSTYDLMKIAVRFQFGCPDSFLWCYLHIQVAKMFNVLRGKTLVLESINWPPKE